MTKRVVFLVLVIFWMALIFAFSSQPSDESTEVSHSVGKKIGAWFVPGYADWQPEKQEEFAAAIDYPVRKTAHASEYAVLALLFVGVLSSWEIRFFHGNYRVISAFVLTAAYASTDEFHQLFVPGRSGRVQDVLIDSLGALVGCLCFLAVRTLLGKIRKRGNPLNR
jgi:VanZ family protein